MPIQTSHKKLMNKLEFFTKLNLKILFQVHEILPMDCRVFIPILEKLRKPVLANQIPDELVNEFHSTSEKLVQNFTTFIR